MMIDKDLEGVVVTDKKKVQSNIRKQIQLQQRNAERSILDGKGSHRDSDKVFTDRRRKLEKEEAQNYFYWQNALLSGSQENQSQQNNPNEEGGSSAYLPTGGNS